MIKAISFRLNLTYLPYLVTVAFIMRVLQSSYYYSLFGGGTIRPFIYTRLRPTYALYHDLSSMNLQLGDEL